VPEQRPPQPDAQRLTETVYESALLDRCRYLAEVDFWAGDVTVHPRAWLDNFQDERSRQHALQVVGALQFYNRTLCTALLVSGLREVTKRWTTFGRGRDLTRYLSNWRRVLDSVSVAVPSDVSPAFHSAVDEAATNSGLPLLSVSPDATLAADDAYVALVTDWLTPDSANRLSAVLSDWDPDRICVLSLFTSAPTPPLSVPAIAVHQIPAVYSLTHPASVVWPEESQTSGPEFVQATRDRLGIRPSDAAGIRGAITFGHRIPETADPILTHVADDFAPLLVQRG
jgi:hypothetical protein